MEVWQSYNSPGVECAVRQATVVTLVQTKAGLTTSSGMFLLHLCFTFYTVKFAAYSYKSSNENLSAT